MDERNYLNPDFDPSTLRVPELRKILLEHNVPFPSTAKKQDLIDLFNKHIAANAAAIIAAQKKVKPSSRGILMVGDRKTSEMYNDSDDEQEESSPIEVKKKGRAKKPVKREESSVLDEEVFAVPAPKPRGRSSKKETLVKSEPEVVATSEFDNSAVTTPQTPVARRGRKKKTEMETPGLTDTDVDDYSKTPRDKSPFSDHNPFQSGGEGSPGKSSRRKSGVSRSGRSTSRSRRSLMHVDSPSDFNTPITKAGYFSPGQPTPPKFGDTVEHPSAFPVTSPAALTTPTPILLHKFMSPPPVVTPDSDDLLEEKSPVSPFKGEPVAEASKISAPNAGTRLKAGLKKKAKRREDTELVIEEYNWASIWVVVLLIILAYGVWWRHEKIKVGYCDQMAGKTQESSNQVSHPLAILYPECIQCPAYAQCNEGLISCDENFVHTRNPLSLGGLIPLSDRCEPDTEKQMHAVEIANELRRQLNIQAGQVECGFIKVNRSLSRDEVAGMKVKDALNRLIDLKDPSVTDDQFLGYWKLALDDLEKHPDQVELFVTNSGDKYLVSREPYLPISCRLRKNFMATLWKYKVVLLGIVSFVALLYFLQQKWVERKRDAKVIAGLLQTVLAKLMDQERYHYVDPVQFPYEGIPVAHLRDLLLAEEHSAKRRQYLWEKVRRIVETNSNVRARMMEVKGEPHRVWEWVGGVTVKKEEPIYPSVAQF